jgi:hypothetical protein
MKCLHHFERTGTEDLGERTLTHLSCAKCPKKRTVNRKKPRYVAQDTPKKLKVKRVPKLSKLLQNGLKSKRKAIKPVSDKRKAQNAEYSVLRKQFLEEHPICQFERCNEPSTQCHHKRGREGPWLTDVTEFMAVCMTHHSWIENNREEAAEKGYLKLRLTTDQLKDLPP